MAIISGLVFVGAWVLSMAWLFGLFGKWKRRQHMKAILSKIPGPPTVPLLGSTYNFKLDPVEFSYQLEEICKTYATDGVMCLWTGTQPIVLLTKASTAEPLLNSNSLITKSNVYELLYPWLGEGLLTSTGNKWRSRRKMLTPAFHFSILKSFMDVHVKQAITLAQVLKPMTKEPFDIFPFIGRCALDIICDTAMGTTVNAQVDCNGVYVRTVQSVSQVVFNYQRMPWLRLTPIWHALGYARTYTNGLGIMKDFTNSVIKRRSQELKLEAEEKGVKVTDLFMQDDTGTKRKVAFLDLLLSMQDANALTQDDIRDEVETFMFEGHDTTASGMGWTVFMLGHHKNAQVKIQAELDEIFGDSDRDPTTDDLAKMKYLERAIKEAMRMYPPVPIFGRQCTQEFTAGGYTVPKGAEVLVLPFLIHRDEEIYTDPDSFDPDRFLPENVAGRHPYAYVPFSAGPRNCIGQKFALMEEKVVISTLLRSYNMESLEDIELVRPIPNLILRPPDKFLVKLTCRN